jgi:L-rhamnonate dehydratase
MAPIRIKEIRAFTVRGGGADYHDQEPGHWIDGQISTPMSKYPEYRAQRRSFGLNVLGSLVVEIEASNGEVGVSVTTGGELGCWIIENHLARFIEGKAITEIKVIDVIWDQMFNATLFYGRKGIVINAISGVDLALWDLLGKIRNLPVYQLLGGAAHQELVFYATGPRPDLAKKMGFIGGKFTLVHGPAEGEAGLTKNLALLREMREKVGDDFWLMYDCWMSLTLEYALELAREGSKLNLKWIEECLPPDDYWGYAQLRNQLPPGMLLTTGEHEATLAGFRLLLEMKCADIIQPDVGWCGGLSELIRIADLSESFGVPVVPHGSSVYSYHFVITRERTEFAEFIMMAPRADEIVPMFNPLLIGEPLPINGKLKVSDFDKPGFGVALNRELNFARPYTH